MWLNDRLVLWSGNEDPVIFAKTKLKALCEETCSDNASWWASRDWKILGPESLAENMLFAN